MSRHNRDYEHDIKIALQQMWAKQAFKQIRQNGKSELTHAMRKHKLRTGGFYSGKA